MMLNVPSVLRKQFAACLQKQAIPQRAQAAYHKWLRYYWDFCHKYHFPHDHKESLPYFIKKLQEKRQTQAQQEQAAHAIGLYYDLLASVPIPDPASTKPLALSPSASLRIDSVEGSGQSSQEGNVTKMSGLPGQATSVLSQERNVVKGKDSEESVLRFGAGEQVPAELPEKTGSASHEVRSGQGASWQVEYARLTETLQGKQDDPKTVKAYTKWLRKFQAFTRSKPPKLLSSEDARTFLTSLTPKRRMTVSKQN